MTSQGNGPPALYSVQFTGKGYDQAKSELQEASAIGKGELFLKALRDIAEKLRSQPRSFGEPMYRLAGLKLVVYHGAIAPLLVDYGVHETQRATTTSARRLK